MVVEPTCTEKGYTTYSCECGNRYVGDYVSAIGHDYDESGICTRCEAERPTSFAPESFTASISKSSVTACKPVTITVKASTDVEYVMINGIKIDSCRTITSGWLFSRTTYRIFTYTVNEAATGSYSYEIYAYNAEGAKSDTSRTVKLKVQESGSFWWK